jgi:hypothetical protein
MIIVIKLKIIKIMRIYKMGCAAADRRRLKIERREVGRGMLKTEV